MDQPFQTTVVVHGVFLTALQVFYQEIESLKVQFVCTVVSISHS